MEHGDVVEGGREVDARASRPRRGEGRRERVKGKYGRGLDGSVHAGWCDAAEDGGFGQEVFLFSGLLGPSGLWRAKFAGKSPSYG